MSEMMESANVDSEMTGKVKQAGQLKKKANSSQG